MVTGLETFEAGYNSALFHWFGGSTQVDYSCGYDFENGKFVIVENETGKIIDSVPGEFTLNEWHHIVFQYYRDNAEIRYYFDPEIDPATGRIKGPDVNEKGEIVKEHARPLFKKSYRYFDAAGVESKDSMVIMRRMNCQIMLDNVEFYNFVAWTDFEVTPGDGGGGGGHDEERTSEVYADIEKREDGTFAVCIPNKDDYKAGGVVAVEFTVDLTGADGKLAYKGLEGVDPASVTVKEDGAAVKFTVKDMSVFTSAGAEKYVMKVILAPAAGTDFTAEQVKGMVKVTDYVRTSSYQTGDNEALLICSGALFATIFVSGVAVLEKEKRKIRF